VIDCAGVFDTERTGQEATIAVRAGNVKPEQAVEKLHLGEAISLNA
jgi:hypothetical protein